MLRTTSSYGTILQLMRRKTQLIKFYAIRDFVKNYLQEGETLPEIPANPENFSVPAITFKQTAALFENLPAGKPSETVQPMEFFDEGWGSILYRKTLPACDHKTETNHQRMCTTGQKIFYDGKLIGKLDHGQ